MCGEVGLEPEEAYFILLTGRKSIGIGPEISRKRRRRLLRLHTCKCLTEIEGDVIC